MFLTATSPRPAARGAFTLIELLVSMAILTLLVLMVSQMVSSVSRVVVGNRERLETDGQARLVFDRMALDLGRMVKRKDVDYIFSSQTGNDKFFFYSEAPAFFDSTSSAGAQSPLSLIGYRINDPDPKSIPPTTTPQLSRLSKGLAWDESKSSTPGSMVFLTYPKANPSPSPVPSPTPFLESTLAGHWPTAIGASPDYKGTDDSYHVLSPLVCRMEICFLLKPEPDPQPDGTLKYKSAVYSLKPYWGSLDHTAINGLQDVQAIVVALVILDEASQKIANNLSTVVTAFPDVEDKDLIGAAPTLMAQKWMDRFKDKTSFDKLVAETKIPATAAAQLRVYQRHFYLDTK